MNAGQDSGHDPFADEVAAYALGALDPEDVEAIEAHLPTCATCQAELARFEATVQALALSLDEAPAPAGHEERFRQKLQAIGAPGEPAGHRERFLQKLEAQGGEPPPATVPAAPAPAPRPVVAPARPWWERWFPAAGWAVAAALVVLLLVGGLAMQNQITTLTDQRNTLQSQVNNLQTQRNTLASIMANPASHAVALSGQVATQTVQMQLWVDPTTQQAALVSQDLPPAPAGKVYEFWLIQGQTPVGIGLVSTDSSGHGLLTFNLPGALSNYQVAAITVEDHLVSAPTTTPIIAGNL